MNIKNRVEKLESRRPQMLLAVIEEGEDPGRVAARCRDAAGAPPRQPVMLVFTGVPQPRA